VRMRLVDRDVSPHCRIDYLPVARRTKHENAPGNQSFSHPLKRREYGLVWPLPNFWSGRFARAGERI